MTAAIGDDAKDQGQGQKSGRAPLCNRWALVLPIGLHFYVIRIMARVSAEARSASLHRLGPTSPPSPRS